MTSRLIHWFVALCLFALVLGCGKSDPTAPEMALMPNATPNQPSGNAVFDNHCMGCHSVTSTTTGMKRKGPNLSKVGVEHKVDWLADHVKDPKSHKPDSGMPEFGSKLKPEEIKSVSEFMAGLK